MIFFGLDLGKMRDPSVVVGVERVDRRTAFRGQEFESILVRYVEQMPLGMSYLAVVERVKEIVQSEEVYGNCMLAVDATGLGAPVVEMLHAARLGCDLTAVTITGGERGTSHESSYGEAGDMVWVPKRDLIAELQMLLEKGQLRIGKLKEAGRLARELADMRMSMSGAGRVTMAAGGAAHDDMVMALALACWRAKGRRLNDWCGQGRII